MKDQSVAILHYSAPPIVGGVEAVIKAHLKELIRVGYLCTVIAGRGHIDSLPPSSKFIEIPEIDSQHPEIIPESAQAWHISQRRYEHGIKDKDANAGPDSFSDLLQPHFQIRCRAVRARCCRCRS